MGKKTLSNDIGRTMGPVSNLPSCMDIIHYLNPEAEVDISIIRDYPEISKYKGESQNADYYQFCMF